MIKRKTRSMIIPKWYKEALDERSLEKHVAPQMTIETIENLENRKLSKKEIEFIHAQRYQMPHKTFIGSVSKTTDRVKKTVKMIRKKKGETILINNIGHGYNLEDDIPNSDFGRGTYEPFFIANALEKAGKKYEIRAFALNPKEVEGSKKQKKLRYISSPFESDTGFNKPPREFYEFGTPHIKNFITDVKIPKRILEKVKFSQLDLITETPAKQADITTLIGIPVVHVPLDTNEIKQMAMLKNAVDSTRHKGYVICNLEPKNEKQICKKFGLQKVDKGIYQKIR